MFVPRPPSLAFRPRTAHTTASPGRTFWQRRREELLEAVQAELVREVEEEAGHGGSVLLEHPHEPPVLQPAPCLVSAMLRVVRLKSTTRSCASS